MRKQTTRSRMLALAAGAMTLVTAACGKRMIEAQQLAKRHGEKTADPLDFVVRPGTVMCCSPGVAE
jgi:hypothetical protein